METFANTVGFAVIFQNYRKMGMPMIISLVKGAQKAAGKLADALHNMVVSISRSFTAAHSVHTVVAKDVLNRCKTGNLSVATYFQKNPTVLESFRDFFEGVEGDNGLV